MIEAIAADLIATPPAIVQEARRRGHSTGRNRSRGAKRAPAWPYIAGAVILLPDGRTCYVWQDHRGRWHCRPENEARANSRRLEQ